MTVTSSRQFTLSQLSSIIFIGCSVTVFPFRENARVVKVAEFILPFHPSHTARARTHASVKQIFIQFALSQFHLSLSSAFTRFAQFVEIVIII